MLGGTLGKVTKLGRLFSGGQPSLIFILTGSYTPPSSTSITFTLSGSYIPPSSG